MSRSTTIFPVVGIGASAGGLDAFKTFFSAMPDESGMAFVLIQHLDPTHESLMTELLARYTLMTVVQAEDKVPLECNRVYIIPPNKYLTLQKGVLRLTKPVERRGLRMPIDYFFRSLADDQQEKAIGIILSGTGTDGTLGMKFIKEQGGMVMVQAPNTAQYDGMPCSAIVTNLVDYNLPVEQMPDELLKYVRHSYIYSQKPPALSETMPEPLNQILSVLQTRSGYDFHYYKKTTLMRRIERRMGLNQIEHIADYVAYLHTNPAELICLSKDMLISVTRFFRDSEAFHELEENILPQLLQDREPNTPLRIWVPGCATGEEAYSIAMLLIEQLSGTICYGHLQIFATDLDEKSLQFARTGIYPESIATEVPAKRLQHFFIKKEQSYQVKKQLRESVVFAVQNLINDPPFSKLDLISCRNLLIYLKPEVQKKLISLFHFALQEGGYLFLGSSETINQRPDLFEIISKKWRIFQRIGNNQQRPMDFPIILNKKKQAGIESLVQTTGSQRSIGISELAQQILLEEYAPASVLIDRKYDIVYFYGSISRYFELPSGEPTHNILSMAREGIREKLRVTVYKAMRDNQSVITKARFKHKGEEASVKITIKPLNRPKTAKGLTLLNFIDEPVVMTASPSNISETKAIDKTLAQQLNYELRTTKEDLQSTIEELETANEELKTSNEEVMSINEELQSTNEELETSKEELQSLNEELSTVNNQLQEKVVELESTNNDLANLLSSTDIATLFLDPVFHIKRFTPSARHLLNLIPTDVGRPISDIANQFTEKQLLTEAKTVLDSLKPLETEIQTKDSTCYIRRILPYRTQDNKIEGVVITFIDITRLKQTEATLRENEARLEKAEQIAHIGNWEWNLTGKQPDKWSNELFYLLGINPNTYQATQAVLLQCIYPDDRKLFMTQLEQAIRSAGPVDVDFRVKHPDATLHYLHACAKVQYDDNQQPSKILGVMLDITERKRIEKALRVSEARFKAIFDRAAVGIVLINGEGKVLQANARWSEM